MIPMMFKRFLLSFVLVMYGVVTNAQVLPGDSLALVVLYNAMGGNNWVHKDNWLKPGQNVSTWYGVDVTDKRVSGLTLTGNNLTGQIPDEVGDFFEMLFLDLSSNQLSGTIPVSINRIDKLLYLFLSDNNYSGQMPAFIFQPPPPAEGGYRRLVMVDHNDFSSVEDWGSDFRNIVQAAIEGNQLDFEDIAPFLEESIPILSYDPQQPIYTSDVLPFRKGAKLTLKTFTGGQGNHYQWSKDGSPIISAKQSELTLNITDADGGTYTADVTSDVVPGLTLSRNPLTLNVQPANIYTSCDGRPMTLSGSVSDPQAVYAWSNGQTTPSITVAASGKYGLRVETPNYVLQDTLVVYIPSTLSLGPDIDVCKTSVALTSNIAGAERYSWKTPNGGTATGPALTATVDGLYILEVTTDICTQRDSVSVVLNHFTSGDFTIMAGSAGVSAGDFVLTDVQLSFSNTTGTGSDFIWSFGDDQTSPADNAGHTYTKAGEYTITLSGTDSRNCPITVQKTVFAKDILITNAISPNGDGKNDKFYIEPFLYGAELKVINRWGQNVYDNSSYNDDFTGSNLESGVYYYELHLKEIDKNYKGYIHIMK